MERGCEKIDARRTYSYANSSIAHICGSGLNLTESSTEIQSRQAYSKNFEYTVNPHLLRYPAIKVGVQNVD